MSMRVADDAPAVSAGGFDTGETPPASFGLFVPALLLALAVVASLGFQTIQLLRDRAQLGSAFASLEVQNQTAVKLRSSLDALATATAKLAADGNANAGQIVADLRKRGVTITPHADAKPN
jgi:hypothetical protein